MESDPFELGPGAYFAVITVFQKPYPLEYSWTIRRWLKQFIVILFPIFSATPTDSISYDSVTFENKVASHQSLLKMVEKLAKPKTEVRKGLFAQEYSRDNFLTLMFENHAEKPIDIKWGRYQLLLCNLHLFQCGCENQVWKR